MSATPLSSLILKAAGWGYLGTVVRLVMQLSVQIVLARLLGPAEYGLFAIGVIVLSLAQFFGDVASSALIPRPELEEEEIRFSITWQLIVCACMSIALALAADPIAALFAQGDAGAVIRQLAPVCVLGAAGGVALALLRRRLDFRAIQLAQIGSYFIGYVLVALPYALLVEASVQALVYGWLAQTIVNSAAYLWAAPHSFRPALNCASAPQLLAFGWSALVANLGSWGQTNLDRVIIARFASPLMTGLYVSSSNLLSTPLSQINATLQQLTFAASARIADAAGRQRGFVGLLTSAMVVYGIAYGFSAAAAETLVLCLWGDGWRAAVPFVQAFSLSLFAVALSSVISPLLWANESVGRDSRIQFGTGLILVVGAVVAVQFSPIAMAWWVAVVQMARALVLILAGLAVFGIDRKAFGRSAFRISLLILVHAGVIFVAERSLAELDVSRLSRLLMLSVLPVAGVCLSVRIRKHLGAGYAHAIDLLLRRVPVPVQRFFGGCA